MAAVMSWVVAQLIKFGLGIILHNRVDLTRLTASGGMPSGHAALVTTVAAGMGGQAGYDSPEFAMAVVIALIVMYDAAGVRQAVGLQARMMNEMLHDLYYGTGAAPVKIREILGHTPVEVIAGAILGFIVYMLLQP